jgi:TetR/AcrR family transcriptional repressor of nem operon
MTQSATRPARTTVQGRATKQRIVQTAADLMFKNGVAGTSIPDIQEAAQVSASQIYHYYGDKQGLVKAVVEYQTDRTIGSQRSVLDHLDSFEALEAWRDFAIEGQKTRHCQGGCELGSLASELVETGDGPRQVVALAFDRWADPLREGLRGMQSNGILRTDADTEMLATALLAALQGGLLMTQIHRDTAPLASVLDAVISHIRTFASVPA